MTQDLGFDLGLAGTLLSVTAFLVSATSEELNVLLGCYYDLYALCYVNHMFGITIRYGLDALIISTSYSIIVDVGAGRPVNRIQSLIGFGVLIVMMFLVYIGGILTTPIQYLSYDISGGPSELFHDYHPTFTYTMLGYRIVSFLFYAVAIIAHRTYSVWRTNQLQNRR